MPELPEVETVRQTLRRKVINKTIHGVEVLHDKIIQMDVERFIERVIGQQIQEIERRGKYLMIELNDYYLISHLRMEGKYFLRPVGTTRDKHDHVIFTFSDDTELRYNDVRKFGTMHLKDKSDVFVGEPLEKLGPEPVTEQLSLAYLVDAIKKRTTAIKNVLLDQTVIAGLGNIYVNEALFIARIHPEQPANTLKKNEIERLRLASIDVIKRAIEQGGTTIRSYYSDDDVTGRFQQELLVHGRKDEKCLDCETVIEKIKVGGRGTYFCPSCQRLKRRRVK